MFNFTIYQKDGLGLCRSFGAEAFRPLISKHPKLFPHGDKLDDEQIVNAVINNYQKSVVSDYLHQLVHDELKHVQRYKEQLMAKGESELDSLSYALLCTLFRKDLDMYLKLSKVTLNPYENKKLHNYIAKYGNQQFSIEKKLQSLSASRDQATTAKSNAPAPKKNEPQTKTTTDSETKHANMKKVSSTDYNAARMSHSALLKSIETSRQRLKTLNVEIDTSRQRLKTLNVEIDTKLKRLRTITDSLDLNSSNLDHIKQELQDKTNELNTITQQIDKKNNELEYQANLAEQQKAQTQAGVVDTSKALVSIKDEHTSKEVDEKTTELERIGKQIDEKNAELEGIGKQIDEKNAELEGIGKQIVEKNAELHGITQQIDKSTNHLGYQATIVDLRSKEPDSDAVDASKQLELIKDEIASKTKERDQVVQDLEVKNNEHQNILAQIIQRNSELREKSKEIELQTKELEHLKQQYSRYATVSKALESSIQNKQRTYANIQDKNAHLDGVDTAPALDAPLYDDSDAHSDAVESSNAAAAVSADVPAVATEAVSAAVPSAVPATVTAVVGEAGAIGGVAVGSASYQIGTAALSEAGQTLTSWDQAIEELAENLACSGVNSSHIDDCCTGLAVFMLSAYLLKQPILLVGPNAIEIIEAFCSTLDDGRYGILSCDGPYNPQAIESIGLNNESIVVINNLLSSSWTNRIHEILSKKDMFFIAVHPYKEDLQVEPSSLYNYFMPVCTEFVVSDIPHGDFVGGHPQVSLSFNENDKNAPRALGFNMLSKFAPSPIAIKRIKRVLSTMLSLTHTKSDEGKSLYCSQLLLSVAPLAYASQSLDTFFELMNEPNSNNEKDFNKVTQLLNFLSGSDD